MLRVTKRVRGAVYLLLVVSLVVPATAAATFRDTIHFRDNQFVGMANTEFLHRYTQISGADSDAFERTELHYQVTTGVMQNFELGIDVPVQFFDGGDDGIGDVSVFQRFKFTEDPSWLESSGGLELTLPTGDDDELPTSTDEFRLGVNGTVSQEFRPRWSWLANGGVTYFGENRIDERYDYNGAVRYRAGPNLKLNTELNGFTGGIEDNSQLYVSPGIIYQSRTGFNIMVSLPVGLTDDSADHRATIQFSHEF